MRSRDPARIDAMLRLIAFIWKKQPDLRLGQLLTNAEGDLRYSTEDDKLYARLVTYYQVPALVALAAEGDSDDDGPRSKPRSKARRRRLRRS